jgi:hypothetical protein
LIADNATSNSLTESYPAWHKTLPTGTILILNRQTCAFARESQDVTVVPVVIAGPKIPKKAAMNGMAPIHRCRIVL